MGADEPSAVRSSDVHIILSPRSVELQFSLSCTQTLLNQSGNGRWCLVRYGENRADVNLA